MHLRQIVTAAVYILYSHRIRADDNQLATCQTHVILNMFHLNKEETAARIHAGSVGHGESVCPSMRTSFHLPLRLRGEKQHQQMEMMGPDFEVLAHLFLLVHPTNGPSACLRYSCT